MWKARTPPGARWLPINGQRLRSQQVQRYRIAGEGIDDQHIEMLRSLFGERGARVALSKADLGR